MPDIDAQIAHKPVLLRETLQFLQPEKGGFYVDATLGLGGHTEAILDSSADSVVAGIDQDIEAINFASERLLKFGDRLQIFNANFSQIKGIVEKATQGPPNGILADLGVSSLQLDSESRGFSFRHDAPLDMRMDKETGEVTAADLLATLKQDELADIIYKY